MPFLKEVAVTVFSSSVVLGIFVFIIKKILADSVKLEFSKWHKQMEHRLERAFKYDDQYLETEMGIYPELLEITNLLKNLVQAALKEELAYKWNGDLRPLTALLTEKVLKHRLIIPEDLFRALHLFKQLCQDFLLEYDLLTRDEYEFDREFYQTRLPYLQELAMKINNTFIVIEKQMRQKIKLVREGGV